MGTLLATLPVSDINKLPFTVIGFLGLVRRKESSGILCRRGLSCWLPPQAHEQGLCRPLGAGIAAETSG